jgi:hypothetical protein
MHGVSAKHVETTHLHEKAPTSETVWTGDVETFAVKHEMASRCFAWSEATTGTKRRFFAVLAVGQIDSPARAVQAPILADAHKGVR